MSDKTKWPEECLLCCDEDGDGYWHYELLPCKGIDDDVVAAEIRKRWVAYPKLAGALKRISYVKPDRLDHATDVGIIERVAALAAALLRELGEDA